jgi:monoamine oxidase
MSASRRDVLKFILVGSVAGSCPFDLALRAAPDESKPPQVEGDHFEICHQIRDGRTFPTPAVSRRCDVLIVGGGASGLAAAYFLRNYDFLLLEKEDHWGGNAYLEEFQGQAFATGSAFDTLDSDSYHLARELGLAYLPINMPDPSIINHKWIPDTWRSGLDELPYSPPLRDSFKKFRASILPLEPDKNIPQFDNTPFSHYLKDYPPEIKSWWDAYGASNWGATSEDTSAYVAINEMKSIAAETPDERITLPGGNGVLSQKLASVLAGHYADHLLSGATVVSISPQKDDVRATYLSHGEPSTISAKYVVMAAPKFIAARLILGLADDQSGAMTSFRYCPYPVINMIFDKPIYNRAYDTWCPGATFTDFIVADWVLQKQPGYHQKNNILTFYTPLSEADRKKLLKEDDCRRIAAHALEDFQSLQPEFSSAQPVAIHFYRRGHPMFMPTPGTFTTTIPLAARPLDRIVFANADSIGPESEIDSAVLAARRSAEWVQKRLAGASASAASASAGLRA